MMLKFPYGRGSIELDVPHANLASVMEPRFVEAARDEEKEIKGAITHAMEDRRVKGAAEKVGRAVIVVSDVTRPAPNRLMVPPIIGVLSEAEFQRENMEVVVANGLHRPASREELEELLGKRVLREVEVVNHDAQDEEQLTELGRTTFGTSVTLNKRVVEADFLVTTGLIEPHFFAGYSGGRKSILPGVAGEKSVFQNHSFRMIDHPKSRYGILRGNPIHEDMIEAAKMVKPNLMVNVVLNKEREIVKAFAGDLIEAHEAGVKFLESIVKVPTSEKADIAITTNGGYPLDRNLYQAVKGMATGELVVRRGGVIIVMAECVDGVEHRGFQRLMEEAKIPDDVFKTIRRKEPLTDQWEAQVLARILRRAEVIVVSRGVEDDLIENMLMTPASTPEEALDLALEKIGRNAKITAVPDGPFVIPYIAA